LVTTQEVVMFTQHHQLTFSKKAGTFLLGISNLAKFMVGKILEVLLFKGAMEVQVLLLLQQDARLGLIVRAVQTVIFQGMQLFIQLLGLTKTIQQLRLNHGWGTRISKVSLI